MKSLTQLWNCLAADAAKLCHTSVTLDIKTIERRIKEEGDSFLTITLPAFGKALERGLDLGRVDSSSFPGFRRGKRGPLPLFLGGFLSQIFDADSGTLLDVPSTDAIIAVRQLTLVFGKIERSCSPSRVEKAFAQYVQTDRLVGEWNKMHKEETPERLAFRRMASTLFSDHFTVLDRLIAEGEVVGKHGPGATADRLTSNKKWEVADWTSRLEEWFPYGEHILPNWRYVDQLDHVTMRVPKDEMPVKVISVPKTLKTPRIIAIEPTCMQYAQQALLDPMVQLLETDRLTREGFGQNRISGMIGFTDQEPNRQLARVGSQGGTLATLDLSEASDRVSMTHVVDLLDETRWPHLFGAVSASRSTTASVPSWGVIHLEKFASMGSALCFPIEAMVFLTTVFLGIESSLDRQITRRDIKSYRDRVRVYGDDIVVPVDCVPGVLTALDRYGFKVNADKSFWTGKFRESCGGDYYDGEWVTPARLRKDLPSSTKDASETISLVSFRNQLYQLGYWESCKVLDGYLERLLGHFPTIQASSPLLGRETILPLEYSGKRISRDTHTPLVRGWSVTSKSKINSIDDIAALRKCLAPQKVKPFEDARHLERSGRPESVRIKLRWSTAY